MSSTIFLCRMGHFELKYVAEDTLNKTKTLPWFPHEASRSLYVMPVFPLNLPPKELERERGLTICRNVYVVVPLLCIEFAPSVDDYAAPLGGEHLHEAVRPIFDDLWTIDSFIIILHITGDI